MRQRKSNWAIPELKVQYVAPKKKPELIIKSTAQVVSFFREIWDDDLFDLQEQFYVLFIKYTGPVEFEIISWRCLHTGTASACLVDIKLLITLALKCGCDGIIVAHNHPKHDATPSEADDACTLAIKDACYLVGLHLRDDIILSRESYYSYWNKTGVLDSTSDVVRESEVNQPPLVHDVTKDLLGISAPGEWKDFLFNTQTNLINYGFMEMLTESGRAEFSARMQGLYDFFGQLDPGNKDS